MDIQGDKTFFTFTNTELTPGHDYNIVLRTVTEDAGVSDASNTVKYTVGRLSFTCILYIDKSDTV